MDPLVIISPHYDDAVLSCGQLMAGRPDTIVATVCTAHGERPRKRTTYDRDCGFRNARHAMSVRAAEDTAACELLQARPERLGFTDSAYGDADVDAMADAIRHVIEGAGATIAVGPVGISHPDHLLVAAAFGRVVDHVQEAWVYEDLPYRVLLPRQAHDRLPDIDERTVWQGAPERAAVLGFLGDGPLDMKDKAIGCYQSQLWALDRAACLMPERHWRLW